MGDIGELLELVLTIFIVSIIFVSEESNLVFVIYSKHFGGGY